MDNRHEIINRYGTLTHLTCAEMLQIAAGQVTIADMSDAQLFEFCTVANACYRGGSPIISDAVYDHDFLAEVKARNPQHALLQVVDDEGDAFEGTKVELPAPMLSTDKAYSREAIEKWLDKLEKAATEIDLDSKNLRLRVTAKLDGFAGYDDGQRLYTRGDGRRGTDITRVFERGLPVYGDAVRGQGPGEIVVKKSYFAHALAEHFEYARNFQASLIKEKALNTHARAAIAEKAAFFVPFAQLPAWEGTIDTLRTTFETVVEQTWSSVDFDVDGVVFEVTDVRLKTHMGANRRHHRWQIVFKHNTQTAQVKVLAVTAQTGRTGKVTPVAELEPTQLSGATIKRASAHHYGMVQADGIGPGAIIELTRSGMVIPKIEAVITPATVHIPSQCPSCNAPLQWDGDALYCPNTQACPAQVANALGYFFKTIGNIDGFGQATIEKLCQQGVRNISEIYALPVKQFQAFGFGDKTAENLFGELARSRRESIEDWRFLGAFGMHRMGLGNCERLLQAQPLSTLFQLNMEEVAQVEGFAELTAQCVIDGLLRIRVEFDLLMALGFNLETTEQTTQQHTPFSGKTLCFTGKMLQGSRDEMTKQAKKLGAKVVVSVTGKTSFLIVGEKVGATKLKNAQEKGVRILTEKEYLTTIKS